MRSATALFRRHASYSAIPMMNSPMMLLIPARIGNAAARRNSAPRPSSTTPTPIRNGVVDSRARGRRQQPQPQRLCEPSARGSAVPLRYDVAATPLTRDVTVDLVIRRRDRLLAYGATGPRGSGAALGTLELQISAGRGSGLLVAHRPAPDWGGGGARPNLLLLVDTAQSVTSQIAFEILIGIVDTYEYHGRQAQGGNAVAPH